MPENEGIVLVKETDEERIKREEDELNTKKRRELSDYIRKYFIPRNGCVICLGFGISMVRRNPKGPVNFVLCKCLRCII